jgi:hypothetical protein
MIVARANKYSQTTYLEADFALSYDSGPVWQGSMSSSTSGSGQSPAKRSNFHRLRVWSWCWSPSRLPK